MGAEQFDLLAKLVQFGELVFLGFAFVGEFIIVFVIVALAPACGALASSGRAEPAGPAAELMPHGDVDHDRSMMPGQAMRTRPARAGTSMGSGVTLVFRAARVMLAVRMVLSVVLAPPSAMSFTAVLMTMMRVAVMLMTVMRVAGMGAAAVMLAFVMFAFVMFTFVSFMGAISVAVMPRLTVPFAVTFVAALALSAVSALAAIVVVIFVLFFVAALAVVVTHCQQIDFKFASVALDGNRLVGGRDFAGQRPKDG